MALYAKAPKTSFDPAPEGRYSAVLEKIVDLGLQENFHGEAKPRLRFVWRLDYRDPQTGYDEFRVSEFFNNSLFKSKKAIAKLRERVEGLLGRELTGDEVEPDGFDLEALLGTSATLTIAHEKDDGGRTWARVKSVETEKIPF